jgi:hypothetical protein
MLNYEGPTKVGGTGFEWGTSDTGLFIPFKTKKKFYVILVGNDSRSKHIDNQIYAIPPKSTTL